MVARCVLHPPTELSGILDARPLGRHQAERGDDVVGKLGERFEPAGAGIVVLEVDGVVAAELAKDRPRERLVSARGDPRLSAVALADVEPDRRVRAVLDPAQVADQALIGISLSLMRGVDRSQLTQVVDEAPPRNAGGARCSGDSGLARHRKIKVPPGR